MILLNRIKIDRKSKVPLYLQIKRQIKEMILTGILSEDAFATDKKISRIFKY